MSPVSWPHIDGIDSADVSRRLGNDLTLFTTTLGYFLRDLLDLGSLAGRAINADLIAHLHKLRGGASALGATHLYRLTSDAETALRRNLASPGVPALLRDIDAAVTRLARGAQPIIDAAQPIVDAARPTGRTAQLQRGDAHANGESGKAGESGNTGALGKTGESTGAIVESTGATVQSNGIGASNDSTHANESTDADESNRPRKSSGSTARARQPVADPRALQIQRPDEAANTLDHAPSQASNASDSDAPETLDPRAVQALYELLVQQDLAAIARFHDLVVPLRGAYRGPHFDDLTDAVERFQFARAAELLVRAGLAATG
ncbi:MAG: Hpt domain-containing protein [Myxococcales bacterium]|nr:Hpt domain-containing protein [Myxococcales bacterium]